MAWQRNKDSERNAGREAEMLIRAWSLAEENDEGTWCSRWAELREAGGHAEETGPPVQQFPLKLGTDGQACCPKNRGG